MKWELWPGLILPSLKIAQMASSLTPVTPQYTCHSPADLFRSCFPGGRPPSAPPRAWSRFLPAFTFFCAARLRCATGSQQMEAPGRTGAEHAELDGLSLSREEIGTDHLITVAAISVFAPSRDANNSLALFQMGISRIQQLTQSEALRKRAATKGFISSISLFQTPICLWQIPHISRRLSNFRLSDANLLKQGKD